jgi:hypothetical protein
MFKLLVGKPAKKEPHGKAELRPECTKLDIIIIMSVYVCWPEVVG